MKSLAQVFLVFTSIFFTSTLLAETTEFQIVIKDHRFHPDTLAVPVNQRLKLLVINEDATPEEFESYELNREKIIPGNSKAIIFIGPLDAGEYPFFGEFNEATAQGRLIAK